MRDSSYLSLLSIFGPGKEGFLFKGLFGKEKLDFQVLLDVPSPRRRCESSQGRLVLHLGEGMVRLGKGSPKLRHVHLSEPKDSECGFSGPPRQGVARLGEQLRLGKGRLRLGKPSIV